MTQSHHQNDHDYFVNIHEFWFILSGVTSETSMTLCCFKILLIISLVYKAVHGYWLSQNRLSWHDASKYCQNYCNSELASIHNKTDNDKCTSLIQKEIPIVGGFSDESLRVWIGLHNFTGTFEWSDGSLWNFGDDISSRGIYPWRSNQPDNYDGTEYCVHFYTDAKTWNDKYCMNKYRFLCNSCEGKLDKYIMYQSGSSCEDNLNTTLASLHDVYDQLSAESLCDSNTTNDESGSIGSYEYNCQIGLKRSTDNNGTWRWDDGTYFDFGNDTSGGKYPWGNNEPDNQASEDCVELKGHYIYNHLWNDQKCDWIPNYICNKPNEFCYPEQWTTMNYDQNNMIFDDCKMFSDIHGMGVITTKRWNSNNFPLVIEYAFKIHEVHAFPGNMIGVTISVDESTDEYLEHPCDYIFVGLRGVGTYLSGNVNYLIEYQDSVGNPKETVEDMEFDRFRVHVMKIELSKDTVGELTIIMRMNGVTVASLIIPDRQSFIAANKYIGIVNTNANVTGKSLFISGTPEYEFEPVFVDTCYNRTSSPTSIPTNASSNVPSTSPTIGPTIEQYGVIITVKMDGNKDTDQLENIVNSFMNEKLEKDCIKDLSIIKETDTENNKTTMTAVMMLCNEESEGILIANIGDGQLDQHLIDTYGPSAEVVEIQTIDGELHDLKNEKKDRSFMWVVYIMVPLLCCCLVIFGIVCGHKIREDRKSRKEHDAKAEETEVKIEDDRIKVTKPKMMEMRLVQSASVGDTANSNPNEGTGDEQNQSGETPESDDYPLNQDDEEFIIENEHETTQGIGVDNDGEYEIVVEDDNETNGQDFEVNTSGFEH